MRKTAMVGVMLALAATAIVAASAGRVSAGETIEGSAQPRTFMTRCAPWKAAASKTIAELAHAGPNADLVRVSDSIAAMRRADRLCELGLMMSACREYDAVIRGIPSRLHIVSAPPMCRSITLDPAAS
jgi:hypothetical protein